MIVSPNNVGVPLVAPSVNVQTEQVARDNRVRQPVSAAVKTAKSQAQRRVNADDKRQRQSSWDPAEHPDYELSGVIDDAGNESPPKSELERLFGLVALASYSAEQGKGYAMRFRLPAHIIDAATRNETMARRRVVIQYFYGQAVAPNTPSEVIAIL